MEGKKAFLIFNELLAHRKLGLWLGGFEPCELKVADRIYRGFDPCAAVDFTDKVEVRTSNDLPAFTSFIQNAQRRVFVILNYDLGALIEPRALKPVTAYGEPLAVAFLPKYEFASITSGQFSLFDHSKQQFLSFDEVVKQDVPSIKRAELDKVKFQKPDKNSYVHQFNKVKAYLNRGDVYEVNFCVRQVGSSEGLDHNNLYSSIVGLDYTPMKCLVIQGSRWALSISPERFMRGDRNRVYAQPMKGTAPRMSVNDNVMATPLDLDPKERAENIMITDLTRNDLSKFARKGSVRVDELCGVYPFGAVNQMISTVSCELKPGCHPIEAVLGAYPMGSMTGAPKLRSMQVINEVEDFQRGLFSGSVGYFDPDGSFDLNVMIRTLFVDADKGEATIPTGGAITVRSTAEAEYAECLLKAGTLINLLMK